MRNQIFYKQQELLKPSLLGFHFYDQAPLFDGLQSESNLSNVFCNTLIGYHESGGNVPEYEKQLEDALSLLY